MLLSARLTRADSPAGNPPADLLDKILQEQWSMRLDVVAGRTSRSVRNCRVGRGNFTLSRSQIGSNDVRGESALPLIAPELARHSNMGLDRQ